MTLNVRSIIRGWRSGKDWVRSSTGWHPAVRAYRKTGATTWELYKTYDTTHPGHPVLHSTSVSSANKTITVTVRMPSDTDLSHATLKYSAVDYPPTERDEAYIYPDGDLQNRKPVSGPSVLVTWTWTPERYDTTYYISTWAVDTSNNPSDRRRLTQIIPSPVAAPAPSPVPSKFTYNCSSSASFDHAGKFWNQEYYGNSAVQAGSGNYAGGWFYGTKITSALATKSQVNKFTIKIQRASSAHGVSTAADIWLVPHKLTSPGNARAKTPELTAAASPVKVGTLTRGQTKTFNVPSAWWPKFLSGEYKGLALYYGSATAWTHPAYVIAYGKGTTSGQVYIEAQ